MRAREKNRELRAKGAEHATAKGKKKDATQKPTSEVIISIGIINR